MDLADVQRCISSVYGKKDGILRRMSIRMPFYLSLRFQDNVANIGAFRDTNQIKKHVL